MTNPIQVVYGFWLSSLREYKVTEQGDDYLKIKHGSICTIRQKNGVWKESGYAHVYFLTKAEAIDYKLAECRADIKRARAAIKSGERTIAKLMELKEGLGND